jgi:hypothetical protein
MVAIAVKLCTTTRLEEVAMHAVKTGKIGSSAQVRAQSGNMLILTSVFMTLIAVFIVIGISYAGLFFVHNRLETSAGEIALAGAMQLNKNDRVGQMNNMVARSRQLVYDSHKTVDEADQSLQHLAQTLYEESMDSAQMLDSVDRKQLLSVCESESKAAMKAKFDEIAPSYNITLPWLRLESLKLNAMKLGKIRNVKSNVWAMTELNELASHDKGLSYMDKLYNDDINAHIPDDSGLTFKIASLAASTESCITPARQTLATAFTGNKDDQLHSATQVELDLGVKAGLGGNAGEMMRATGTAATTGGATQL